MSDYQQNIDLVLAQVQGPAYSYHQEWPNFDRHAEMIFLEFCAISELLMQPKFTADTASSSFLQFMADGWAWEIEEEAICSFP